jgi:phage terminase large subunit-like protein
MKSNTYTYKELMIETIRRRKEEKYRFYEPIGKVEEFLNNFGSCDFFVSVLSAANGVGKTTLIGNILANLFYPTKNSYFHQKLFQDYPYSLKRGRIVSEPTTIKETIIPMLEEWLIPGTYKREKMGKNYYYHWEIEGGWAFDIMSYDQAVKEFESITLGWCLFDEPPPEPIYKATVSRMRRGGIIGIFMTPLAGSAWIYDDIIANQNNDEGERYWSTAEMEDACFPLWMEILTDKGWKSFKNIDIETDKFASVDIENSKYSFKYATRLVEQSRQEFVDLNNGIVCTPDHEFPAIRDDGKIHRVKAQQLYRGNRLLDRTYLGGEYNNLSQDNRFTPYEWAEFLGWFISEGCTEGSKSGTNNHNQVIISQTTKVIELEDFLSNLQVKFKKKKSGDYWICDKDLHNSLSILGTATTKYLPEYVFNSDEKYRKLLLKSLVLGDGDESEKAFRYRTASIRLADDVQRLGMSLGYKTTIHYSLNKTRKIKNKVLRGVGGYYSVRIIKGKQTIYVEKKPEIYSIEPEEVRCVTVEDGYIIVRNPQIKTPVIAGNCIEHGVRGFLKHKDIERIVNQFSEEDKQARVKGQFQHLTGLVFKQFQPQIHVIEPFDIDIYNYVVVEALDTHPRVPDALLYVAINEQGQHFVIDESFENNTTSQLAFKIKQKRSNYRVVKKLIEPAAFNQDQHRDLRQGQYASLADELYYEHGLDFEAGSKRRLDAIKRIGDYLSYQKIGDQFITSPQLYIFSSCTRLKYEIMHYLWDEWRGKSAEYRSKKETPMDKDDHLIEDLGRILLENVQFTPYVKPSSIDNNSNSYSSDPYAKV